MRSDTDDLTKRVVQKIWPLLVIPPGGWSLGRSPAHVTRWENHAEQVAKAAIAECQRWLPIKDAPRDGTDILGYSVEDDDWELPIILRWFKDNGLHAWRDWDADPQKPTHFMPLSKGPAEDMEAAG